MISTFLPKDKQIEAKRDKKAAQLRNILLVSTTEEKGIYFQYYDETHDNGDYGEKYFIDIWKFNQNPSMQSVIRHYHNSTKEMLMIQTDIEKAHEKYEYYSIFKKLLKA